MLHCWAARIILKAFKVPWSYSFWLQFPPGRVHGVGVRDFTPGLINERNTVEDVKTVLPNLCECQLCIKGYFKTPLEKDFCREFFEVGNDLLVQGLEQRSCVRGQELHGYETELPCKSSSKPGGWAAALYMINRTLAGTSFSCKYRYFFHTGVKNFIHPQYKKVPHLPSFSIGHPHHI